MDWMKVISESISKEIGTYIGIAAMTLLVFLRKIPKYVIEKFSEARNIRAINVGGEISDEVTAIEENSFAMYNHILFYENGGGLIEKDKKIHMTIKWERVGHLCSDCTTDCPIKGNVPKLKDSWQHVEVSEGWRKVVQRTVNAKGAMVTIDIDNDKDISSEVRDIWESHNIFRYREIVIKHTRMGFWTLGLSYCRRLYDKEIPEGLIKKSVNRLKELL